jgi:hypothetical protein
MCAETKIQRKKIVSKKWFNMNGEVVYKKMLWRHNKAMIIQLDRYLDKITHMCGTCARHVGATGKLIIWRLGQAWRTDLRAPTHTAGNFRRNSFARAKNLTMAPYFRLFQWPLSAHYRLTPRAGDRLAHPKVRPSMGSIIKYKTCT